MGSLFRYALAPALVASLAVPAPAPAQGQRCTRDALTVDGSAILARFCIPSPALGPSITVDETFSAAGNRMLAHSVNVAVVAGAQVSRTIDDVDLAPLGIRRSLHMTLAYRGGTIQLEHALALPGATPVK